LLAFGIVRHASIADADIIADFNMCLAKESENLDLDRDILKAGVISILDDKSKGLYFVAVNSSDIVMGQLMITYEWSDWKNCQIWWIQSVYIAPQHRRKGIFKTLYAYVSKLAKDSGACGVRLYADVGNKKAHAAYERIGMTSHYVVYESMW